MANFLKYAVVILDDALDKPLDYGVTDPFIDKAQIGMRVEVPVRNRLAEGYISSFKDHSDFSVKPISRLLSEEAWIPPPLFQLALWMAKYYCTPLSKVLKCIVPATVRSLTKIKQQLLVRRAKPREVLQELCKKLRTSKPAQAAILDAMLLAKKEMFLSELLEITQSSRSPVDTLVKQGILLVELVNPDRSPLENEKYIKTKAKRLNSCQKEALEKIRAGLQSGGFATHLLYGVTGSGKTEVYMQAIEETLRLGKGAIILVPEIALTTQTIERFRSRFEEPIAILHHRISSGERSSAWHKVRQGQARIIIGARSAIFCPMPNIGLIIVDEEHDQSYKQTDEMPTYNARDIAVMRGNIESFSVILGSATPSLESYYNMQKGKYILSKLNSRADTASLPAVTVVNMKKEFEKAKGFTNFSDKLLDGIAKRQAIGEQTILFLNRRGYHTTLSCQQCSHTIKCIQCDIPLTFHQGDHLLACHLCGFTVSHIPKQCPQCKHPDPLKFKGVGTELIEKSLHAVLPDVRTLRIDADTTRHKGSHQKLFRAFATGKADVLIGTQMVAKGLHFPQVTLVGVINCDSALHIPDFRASEQVFQLITQVAGRAGRGSSPGEVIIQTNLDEYYTIRHAAKQDYESFFKEEMELRKLFHFPPATQMVKLVFFGEDEGKTLRTAQEAQATWLSLLPDSFTITQAIPAGYAKVKNKYRFHFFITGPSTGPISALFDQFKEKAKIPKSVQMKIDVNPASTFF